MNLFKTRRTGEGRSRCPVETYNHMNMYRIVK